MHVCMWRQILRYNQTTAYDTHMDWIGTNSLGTEHTDHDYDSAVDLLALSLFSKGHR